MIIRTNRGYSSNNPINLASVEYLYRAATDYKGRWSIEFRTIERFWYFNSEAERDEVYQNILDTGVFVHTSEVSPMKPNYPINLSLVQHMDTREKTNVYEIVFFYLEQSWTFKDQATRDRVYKELLEQKSRIV